MNARTLKKLEEVRERLETLQEAFIYTDIADEVRALMRALEKKLEWIDKHGDKYKKTLTKNQRRAHLQFERGAGSALHGLEILWKALERVEDVT